MADPSWPLEQLTMRSVARTLVSVFMKWATEVLRPVVFYKALGKAWCFRPGSCGNWATSNANGSGALKWSRAKRSRSIYALGRGGSMPTAVAAVPGVLRAVLSYSLQAYSEAVFHQTTENLIRGVENGFPTFGGVTKTLPRQPAHRRPDGPLVRPGTQSQAAQLLPSLRLRPGAVFAPTSGTQRKKQARQRLPQKQRLGRRPQPSCDPRDRHGLLLRRCHFPSNLADRRRFQKGQPR